MGKFDEITEYFGVEMSWDDGEDHGSHEHDTVGRPLSEAPLSVKRELIKKLQEDLGAFPQGTTSVAGKEFVDARSTMQLETLIRIASLFADKLGIPRQCLDGKGELLAVGDVLVIPAKFGGGEKTVLEVGHQWATLSYTDNPKKIDTDWYENEFVLREWVKKHDDRDKTAPGDNRGSESAGDSGTGRTPAKRKTNG